MAPTKTNGRSTRPRPRTTTSTSIEPRPPTSTSLHAPNMEIPYYPKATAEERRKWKGWVEIESNPEVFNLMLHDFGVAGLKVQDVWGLEQIPSLPKPVYGIIFCFQYQDTDQGTQETAPAADIWFATQVKGTLACASIALLNIINNISDLQIGPELQKFRIETLPMNPTERGQALNDFQHVKISHNQFARKIDMLNLDLGLQQHRETARKKLEASRRRNGIQKRNILKKTTLPAYDKDALFHYVAYMPIGSSIYKLDGLDKQPQYIASCTGSDWLETVRTNLELRMQEWSDDDIRFSILAIAKDSDQGASKAEKETVCADYGPAIQEWLVQLAMGGHLKGLAEGTIVK